MSLRLDRVLPCSIRGGTPLVIATLAAVSAGAGSAHASGFDVWKECVQTGTVTPIHSQADYRDALANPPGDGAEYSPCLDDIRIAQGQAAAGGAAGGGSAGGGSPGGSAGGSAASGEPTAQRAAAGAVGGVRDSGSWQALDPAALRTELAAAGVDPVAQPAAIPAPSQTSSDDPLALSALVGTPPTWLDDARAFPLPLAAVGLAIFLASLLSAVLTVRVMRGRAARA